MQESQYVKAFYRERGESNWSKRYGSCCPLRRYHSRTMWRVVAEPLEHCPLVLDAGCGDGVLSVLLARSSTSRQVIAMDISSECVQRARESAISRGVADRVKFVIGDAERLPFKKSSFAGVVSCHVIEHLDDFDRGVEEVSRVLRADGVGMIAIPACLNPAAVVLLTRR